MLTPLLARWLRVRGHVDRPDHRRNHLGEVPRGGGLTLALGLTAGLLLVGAGGGAAGELWVACLVMVVALCLGGALDDLGDPGVGARIIAQIAIAAGVLLVWDGVGAIPLGGNWYWSQPVLLSVLALIAFLWVINLHNFMDGSDGLAAQQAIWTGLAYAAVFFPQGDHLEALTAGLLVCAAAGFMIWNRPPARIFLGDAGSWLIGGVIAWLALRALQTHAATLAVCVLISSVFVVDATATLLARLRRGERWYTPHRSHAFQRLIDSGWSHATVLMTYAAVNLLVVLPAFVLALVFPSIDLALSLAVIVALLIGWLRIQSGKNGD
jgi:Fuc2NAc and GlcNAc transferase